MNFHLESFNIKDTNGYIATYLLSDLLLVELVVPTRYYRCPSAAFYKHAVHSLAGEFARSLFTYRVLLWQQAKSVWFYAGLAGIKCPFICAYAYVIVYKFSEFWKSDENGLILKCEYREHCCWLNWFYIGPTVTNPTSFETCIGANV